MKFKFSLAAASLLVLGALTAPIASAQDDLTGPAPDHDRDTRPHGRGHIRDLVGHAGKGGGASGNGISYHGGPVMHGVVNIYFIWYGNWGNELANATAILTDWANTIGGSPYEAINTTYSDTTGSVSGQIKLAGQAWDYSLGDSLSDANIATIVSNALNTSKLPVDANGVYMVLTAPGVNETSGFLTQYCGWHTYGTYGATNIKYAFIGDADGPKLANCAQQTGKSPNGDPGVDAMVSVMSHELEESASDPLLNAWYDSSGNENADKCAWTFGTVHAAANGSMTNVHLGSRDFLIQQNWLNLNGGSCVMAYNPSPNFSLSASPGSQSVAPGGTTGAYTVTATPLNGWSGSVNYTVSGLPSGATAGVATNLITIATTTATAAGTYVFTITGKDGSNLTNTTTATLVVTAPPPPNFTLSISPSTNTVHRPGTAIYIVTITPQNSFIGTVTLSTSGAKTGVTLTPSPTSLPGSGTSTLTASVTNSAKRGTITITVTGKSGTITKSASATLQIQ